MLIPNQGESWPCQTADQQQCTFPFRDGSVYVYCSNRICNLGDGKCCAIDATSYGNFKSYGVCKEDCPGGNCRLAIF